MGTRRCAARDGAPSATVGDEARRYPPPNGRPARRCPPPNGRANGRPPARALPPLLLRSAGSAPRLPSSPAPELSAAPPASALRDPPAHLLPPERGGAAPRLPWEPGKASLAYLRSSGHRPAAAAGPAPSVAPAARRPPARDGTGGPAPRCRRRRAPLLRAEGGRRGGGERRGRHVTGTADAARVRLAWPFRRG